MTRRSGFPIVVAAPSGTGKTTVCRQVVEHDGEIVFSVSHTTRARRSGESDGTDYHFVDEARFLALVDEDAFLEHAVYNENRYGTSHAALDGPMAQGLDVLLEIEVQGARQVRERRPDARFVFLLPPSFATLRERLRGRGTDAPEQIERRLEVARRELLAVSDFDYAVVNDDLDRCVADVLSILAAERSGDPAEARRRLAPDRPEVRAIRPEPPGAGGPEPLPS